MYQCVYPMVSRASTIGSLTEALEVNEGRSLNEIKGAG